MLPRSLLAACLAAIFLALLAGCGSIASSDDLSIKTASSVGIYEGLPHPVYEPEVYWAEKGGTKSIKEFGDQAIYAEPLDLQPEEVTRLAGLLGTSTTYHAFGGEKKCGGFHTDYAVEWRQGSTVRTTLLCFGCGEAMILGPKGQHRFDLDPSALTSLRSLLGTLRKNRPKPTTLPG